MEEHMCGVWRSEENVMETVLSSPSSFKGVQESNSGH